MENKMAEVAKLLGVELEEEFRLNDLPEKFKITENGMMFWSSTFHKWCDSSGISNALLTGKRKIIKLPKPILDNVEKNYLSKVIKPFRDRVLCIRKYEYHQDEYIGIYLEYYNGASADIFSLPEFEKGTMYKGMEAEKDYTLEELGL